MNKKSISILAALLLFFVLPKIVSAQFYVLETENLRLVYYGKLQEYLAKHVARSFENSLKFHSRLYDYQPSEKVTVVLHDMFDYNNAGATTSPLNGISMAIAPPSYAFETTPSNERINATMNHELVHIVANDKAVGPDNFFRFIFSGKIRESSDHPESILFSYLTGPRRSSPRWYQEGIAVFLETWMAGGLGRALSSYDEMVFRTLVYDSARIYDLVGLESEGINVDFQVGVNSYLYGTRFMSYLALIYGPQKVVDWTNRNRGSKGYFATQFKKIFGEPLDKIWNNWIVWEREFQKDNLKLINTYQITDYRSLSDKPLGSVSRGAYDAKNNQVILGVNYPGQVASIQTISSTSGVMNRVCDIKGPSLYFVTSLTYDSSNGNIFYTTDNNNWRDLRVVNLESRESKTLIKDARVGDLTFNNQDKSLWGIRHFNGFTTLVRIPPPYDEWNKITIFPFGNDLYGISISPDGKHISAGLSDIDGTQRLIFIDVAEAMAGDSSYQVLFDFENSIPSNFTWSPDGNFLIGTSYYSGVSNVFRFSFEKDEMQGGSNTETGFFNPIPISKDSVIIFKYTSGGFQPIIIENAEVDDISAIDFLGQKIVEQHPLVKDWLAPPPSSIDLSTLVTDSGAYHALGNLTVASIYPVAQGYGDYPAYGLHFELKDPINQHNFNGTVTYTPNSTLADNERWHGNLTYSRSRLMAIFNANKADFYDLFGPTKSSRKGFSLGLTYTKTIYEDTPKKMNYKLNLTGFWDMVKLPEFQNITISYDKFLSFNGSINYSNRRSSLGAVDYEKGISFQLVSNLKYVNKKLFSRFNTNIDFGIPLPIYHSSVWLRSSGGFSPNDVSEPLANFYFGGFGNNWIDHGSVKRYRSYYSFPGIELNALGGVNYVKSVLEWSLPPIRFRRMGTPFLYASWLRTSLFAGGIMTNIDNPDILEKLGNAGAQMDIRFNLMSHLRLTFSVGYAYAFDEGFKPTDEFMFSVKIM